jgi:uncharacterized membrane protein
VSFFYRTIIKGVLTLLPITLTIYLLVWFATETEAIVSGPLQTWFPRIFSIPGAGFAVGLMLIFFVGLAVSSYVTKRFVEWFEGFFGNLPVVRTIYGPIRDLTKLFSRQDSAAHQRVVMVRLGGAEGPEILGLITRDHFDDLPTGTVPEEAVAVFVPFSYGMGGFTFLVPKHLIRETTIPAERAMQLAITGWIKSSK